MAKRAESYFKVLTEAINDMIEHGFDSAERVAFWQRKLRDAAEYELKPDVEMQRVLRDGLTGIYQRLTEGHDLERSTGVSRFTVEKLKPHLRAELDRRILASADLIRLNRQQAIDKTLQRFSGWATSIPPGGVTDIDRREEKDRIRKPLAQVKFEQRRVVIDQGHKLTASINEVVARDGGAIAVRWNSRWRVPGYNYRPDHKERDQRIYLLKGNWASEKGLVKPGDAGWYEDVTAFAQEPFCLPGDALVPFADGVQVAYRRWYDGEMVTIATASGKTLVATPNHPVLTVDGWIAIGDLKEGDHVIQRCDHAVQAGEEDQDGAVPRIADLFAAVGRGGLAEKCSGKAEQFHGDGTEGDVDIVWAARPLRVGVVASGRQRREHFRLPIATHRGSGLRALEAFVQGGRSVLSSCVRGIGQLAPATRSFAGHSQFAGLGNITRLDADLSQQARYDRARYAESPGKGQDAFSASVERRYSRAVKRKLVRRMASILKSGLTKALTQRLRIDTHDIGDVPDRLPFHTETDRVVHVNRDRFVGHVYNLQTEEGYYVAQGIVTHNCQCRGQYLFNLRQLPADMLTQKGADALAEARAKIAAMA